MCRYTLESVILLLSRRDYGMKRRFAIRGQNGVYNADFVCLEIYCPLSPVRYNNDFRIWMGQNNYLRDFLEGRDEWYE